MTLLLATDPPLPLTHIAVRRCRPGPSTSTTGSPQQRAVAPGRCVNICVQHTDYVPLPVPPIARLAAELVRTPSGGTTIERFRVIGAAG